MTSPIDPAIAAAAFREEAGWHELDLQAVEYVDRLVEDAIAAGDRAARARGIQPLKAFLECPDSLDEALAAFCYGVTLADRLLAAEQLMAWMSKKESAA